MSRMSTISISLTVIGALLYITGVPFSPWEQHSEIKSEATIVTVPVDVPLIEFMAVSDSVAEPIPFELDAVVPPYIILERGSTLWGPESQQAGIHISIRTMPGSYSEYAALQSTNQKDQQVSLSPFNGHSSLTPPWLESPILK